MNKTDMIFSPHGDSDGVGKTGRKSKLLTKHTKNQKEFQWAKQDRIWRKMSGGRNATLDSPEKTYKRWWDLTWEIWNGAHQIKNGDQGEDFVADEK